MGDKEIHIGDGDRIKIERPFHWGVVMVVSVSVVVLGAIAGMALWLMAGRAAAPPPTPVPATAVVPPAIQAASTATPAPTPTLSPTLTPTFTSTPTPTPASTPTLVHTPAPTPVPTAVPTPTATPMPTSTPRPVALITSVNPSSSGIASGSGTYTVSTSATILATANSGWEFKGWSGDASGTQNPITITMDGNKSIIASFSRLPVILITSVSPSGAGSVSPSGGTHPWGASVTLTASAASGWQFSSWGGDASGAQNPVVINMNAHKKVTAVFAPAPSVLPKPTQTPAPPRPPVVAMSTTEPPKMGIVFISGVNWATGEIVSLQIFGRGATTPTSTVNIVAKGDGSFATL